VLLVNLLASLNFANVFKNKKRLKNKKNVKNVTKIKKVKNVFTTVPETTPMCTHLHQGRSMRGANRRTIGSGQSPPACVDYSTLLVRHIAEHTASSPSTD